jgi:glucosamine 6-phosphate synthetase-like amidotransferase/phosphosugar isomerase protein
MRNPVQVNEVKARDAKVIGFTFVGNDDFDKSVDEVFYLPLTVNELSPILPLFRCTSVLLCVRSQGQ